MLRAGSRLEVQTIRYLLFREASSGPATIGLYKDLVKLSVASETSSIDSLCEVLLGRLPVLIPEAGQAQRVSVPGQADTNLAMKKSAQVRLAHAACLGQSREVVWPVSTAQQLDRPIDGWMQKYGIAEHLTRLLSAPAKQ